MLLPILPSDNDPDSPTSLAYLSLPARSISTMSQGWCRFLGTSRTPEPCIEQKDDGGDNPASQSPDLSSEHRLLASPSPLPSPSNESCTGTIRSPSTFTAGAC